MRIASVLLLLLYTPAMASSISEPYKVCRGTDEWTGETFLEASATVRAWTPVSEERMSIVAYSREGSLSHGGWLLSWACTVWGGTKARLNMKVIYADSTSQILRGREGCERSAHYYRFIKEKWWYIGSYNLHSDILKDAIKLVVYLDDFAFERLPPGYWVFHERELRELRKVSQYARE